MRQTVPARAPYAQSDVHATTYAPPAAARAPAPVRSRRERPVTLRRPAAPTRQERRLARALRRGDADALQAVHEAHGSVVFGFLRRALRDEGEAEDVFQQVMLEVWNRGADYDPSRASMLTWIMTIARSRAIDAMRRHRPEPRDPASLPEVGAPEAELDRMAERWRIAGLLQRLSEDERDLLRMRFHDELSQTEIAARTGVPLGTVKTRMVRALERLRELIDAEEAREARRLRAPAGEVVA